jgi:putative transcriptional regulator
MFNGEYVRLIEQIPCHRRAAFDNLATHRGRGHNRPMSSSTTSPSADFLTGQLLIAMPAMADPRFSHCVIYMCAHTPDGAMGLVINRSVVTPTFNELVKQLGVIPDPPARQIRLCSGGPVESSRGFVLHTVDWTGEGSLKVNDEFAVTASLEVLQVVAGGGGPRRCLLALGYAGWGPGQLDHEIQQNTWLSAPSDETLIFDGEDATKWRQALGKLSVDPLLLSDAMGHA